VGQIRIIGGKWRNRRLTVVPHPSLRPTPDRVRETLFNWLQQDLVNARCLDLFAGTGILGLEALSRGAAHVTFVDNYPQAIRAITQAITTLNAEKFCDIVSIDAMRFIAQSIDPWDIIFLDPPFDTDLLIQLLSSLPQTRAVAAHTLIYIESPTPLTADVLGAHWRCLKQKTAGDVAYHLVQRVF